jgi:hypothetical protein
MDEANKKIRNIIDLSIKVAENDIETNAAKHTINTLITTQLS